jgi:hypothetical protein
VRAHALGERQGPGVLAFPSRAAAVFGRAGRAAAGDRHGAAHGGERDREAASAAARRSSGARLIRGLRAGPAAVSVFPFHGLRHSLLRLPLELKAGVMHGSVWEILDPARVHVFCVSLELREPLGGCCGLSWPRHSCRRREERSDPDPDDARRSGLHGSRCSGARPWDHAPIRSAFGSVHGCTVAANTSSFPVRVSFHTR